MAKTLRAPATPSASARIRARLDHPVIDTDGHFIEIEPILIDYIAQVCGARLARKYREMVGGGRFWAWHHASDAERRRRRINRPPYWALPTTNSADRAAAMIPGLWRARMDEFGIDLTLAYPTVGLMLMGLPDEEMRLGFIRAANTMVADLYRGQGDRIIPAATIPTHTPAEAIAELEHVTGTLGMKLAMVNGIVRRPIAAAAGRLRNLSAAENGNWVDALGLDSEHDYDPFWQRCIDLGVAPTMHSHAIGLTTRCSISSYNYNHIGHFADASEASAKALFLGGVTRRFPQLTVAFLECGVGWAVSLYHDLIGHWEKRNLAALKRHLDPAKIDQAALVAYAERYGDPIIRAKVAATGRLDGLEYFVQEEDPATLDEWAASGVQSAADIRDRFVAPFYFGCEADDASVGWAFDGRGIAGGARLNAMFSSDIGHWDVQDARHMLAEAYELVEHERIQPADFRDFTFTNTVRLHGRMNPAFFAGTAVAAAAAAVLAPARARRRVAAGD
ncbi:MAG: amidohydrolase [Alphaproteobacteria bacterium]|nr:amidohydrolase [Alphaproteobacteria bacterium]